jgi:non-lysosomal glucosylceramidase
MHARAKTVPELGAAAFRSELGRFAAGPPCSPHNYQGCAGDANAPSHPPMQFGNPMAQPGLGIPVGGIGAGSFMINQAGTFGPWNMGGSISSNYENRILPQAAFHLRANVEDETASVRTLAVNTSQFGSVLPAWQTVPAGSGTYAGLYPFGAIDYGEVQPGIDVILDFWSPIVKNDEESSSQPVAYFDVTLENTSAQWADVSTMFTFPNAPTHVAGDVQNTPSEIGSIRTGFASLFQSDATTGVSAVTLSASGPQNTPDSEKTEWALAVIAGPDHEVSHTTSWDANGDGGDIYAAFLESGSLPNAPLDGTNSAGALAVSVRLEPGQITVVRFALAWDFPVVTFGTDHGTEWMRRYTSFYGGEQDSSNAYVTGSYPFHQGFTIAQRNLVSRDQALQNVLEWWRPIAEESRVPAAVRMAALNEVNQLVFNGSFWESGLVKTTAAPSGGVTVGSTTPGLHLFNTVTGGGWADTGELNVQAQATSVFLELFPSLEKSWVRATSHMVAQDPHGRVPDSPGYTTGSPWITWEASTGPAEPEQTFIDTPLKYLIRSFAAYAEDGDSALLEDVYADRLRAWIHDVAPRVPADNVFPTNPTLLSNTYDVLGEERGSTGVYVSGLYLLGLEVMIQSTKDAAALGVPEAIATDVTAWERTLATAKIAFEATYWTGTYYRFTDQGAMSTDVFADAMWPHYRALQLGLPGLFSPERVVTHLRTAFRVLTQVRDATGRLVGMPNAVPIDGKPYEHFVNDLGFQSGEVWTGANYAISAQYLTLGSRYGADDLVQMGRKLAEDVIHHAWAGDAPAAGAYAFNTPEAWNAWDTTIYRSPDYVRVLAVWDLLRAYQEITRGLSAAGGK